MPLRVRASLNSVSKVFDRSNIENMQQKHQESKCALSFHWRLSSLYSFFDKPLPYSLSSEFLGRFYSQPRNGNCAALRRFFRLFSKAKPLCSYFSIDSMTYCNRVFTRKKDSHIVKGTCIG